MSCYKCDFGKECYSNKIRTWGNKFSKYFIIIDYPSKGNDQVGSLLEGNTGLKLRYFLKKTGIKITECFITTALRCFPDKTTLKNDHLDNCRPYLFMDIVRIQPKLVITMGRWSYQMLTKNTSIKEFRGHFDSFKINGITIDILPTFSPNSSMSRWENDQYIIHDLNKAKKYYENGGYELTKPPEVNTVLDLKNLKKTVEKYQKAKDIVIDFETTGLKHYEHKIFNAGYSIKENFVDIIFCKPYKKEHTLKWDKENLIRAKEINKFIYGNYKEIHKAMREIHGTMAKKIGANLSFDIKFSYAQRFPIKNYFYDLTIGHSLLNENMYHDLNSMLEFEGFDYGAYDTLLWKWTNKDSKKKKSYQFVPPSTIEKYLGIDVDGARKLYKVQYPKIVKEFKYLMFKQQMPLRRLMIQPEFKGVNFNLEGLQKLSAELSLEIDKTVLDIRKNVHSDDFNPASPQQVIKHFTANNYPFEKINAKTNKKSGNYSVDAKVLKKFSELKTKKYSTLPNLLLKFRTLSKMKSTYLDGKDGISGITQFIDGKNKLHYNFNIHTPRTGRASANDAPIQTLPNVSNKFMDLNVRRFIIPDRPGDIIWSADKDQLEMRISSIRSKDPVMIDTILNNDIHTVNCIEFGHKLEFVPKGITVEKFNQIRDYKKPENFAKLNDEKKAKITRILDIATTFNFYRALAKKIGFGLNYGIEAGTIAEEFSIDKEDVEKMIEIYFNRYRVYNKWRERTIDRAFSRKYLQLPSGRYRRLGDAVDWINFSQKFQYWSTTMLTNEIKRQCLNFPIQGEANDIFVQEKLKFAKEMKKAKMKSRILLSIHDGIIGSGPVDEIKELVPMSKECMYTLLKNGNYSMPLTSDFEIYDSWYGNKLNLQDYLK